MISCFVFSLEIDYQKQNERHFSGMDLQNRLDQHCLFLLHFCGLKWICGRRKNRRPRKGSQSVRNPRRTKPISLRERDQRILRSKAILCREFLKCFYKHAQLLADLRIRGGRTNFQDDLHRLEVNEIAREKTRSSSVETERDCT